MLIIPRDGLLWLALVNYSASYFCYIMDDLIYIWRKVDACNQGDK